MRRALAMAHACRPGPRAFAFGIWGTLAVMVPGVEAQEPSASPPPASPAPEPAAGNDAMVLRELVERLRRMEEDNKKLASELQRTSNEHAAQLRQLMQKYDDVSRRLADTQGAGVGAEVTAPASRGNAPTRTPAPGGGDGDGAEDPGSPIPDYYSFETEPGPATPRYRISNIANPPRVPLRGAFGPGFQFQTEDEEFRLQIHVLSQTEARVWGPPGREPGNSGFFFPRQRFFFNGRITRPVEYVFSINRGLNSLDLLDAFVNYHPDSRFQLRVGRYMTPLGFDQFAIRPMWLPTPERSLFTTNLGLNRQIGAMAWGFLFDDRLDYAAGVFNGSRNSFQSLNNAADFIGFLNARPFQDSEALWFAQFLNLGTSVAYGYQDQPPVPMSFRVGAVSPDAAVPGVATVPFLILQPGVIERGNRLLGSVHGAYYFRGLSLLGEWQYGYNSYATAARPSPVTVPVSGYYVTAAYFLTGEHVESRTMIRPRRPLIPTSKTQSRGPGAWEAVARVSELRLGESVFTGGFADPNLWSNSALTTELGVNWYWNEHFKIYMFWLHGEFGDPVLTRPGGFQQTADLFWLRMQLWF
ncbi:MAG: porin [Isosphaeraceae bacterium]